MSGWTQSYMLIPVEDPEHRMSWSQDAEVWASEHGRWSTATCRTHADHVLGTFSLRGRPPLPLAPDAAVERLREELGATLEFAYCGPRQGIPLYRFPDQSLLEAEGFLRFLARTDAHREDLIALVNANAWELLACLAPGRTRPLDVSWSLDAQGAFVPAGDEAEPEARAVLEVLGRWWWPPPPRGIRRVELTWRLSPGGGPEGRSVSPVRIHEWLYVFLVERPLCPPQPPPQRDSPYRVELKRRRFLPPAELALEAIRAQRRGTAEETVHFLLQLHPAFHEQVKSAVAAAGVTLLVPIGGTTSVASARVGELERLAEIPMVRAALPILPEDKLHPLLAEGAGDRVRRTADGRIVLYVSGFKDVPLEQLQELVVRAGSERLEVSKLLHGVTATFPPGVERRLIEEDVVLWVEPGQRWGLV